MRLGSGIENLVEKKKKKKKKKYPCSIFLDLCETDYAFFARVLFWIWMMGDIVVVLLIGSTVIEYLTRVNFLLS